MRTMPVGLFFNRKADVEPFPVAGFTVKCPGFNDFWGDGFEAGQRSPRSIKRPFFKGLIGSSLVGQAAKVWGEIVAGNEPDNPLEEYRRHGVQVAPADFADWFAAVCLYAPDAEVWFPGPSGRDRNLDWLRDPRVQEVIREHAAGVALHVYGTRQEVRAYLRLFRSILPDVPFGVQELNPGWGRPPQEYGGSLTNWTRDDLPGILDDLEEAGCAWATYFAAEWTQDDASVGEVENLSAIGSPVIPTLRAWQSGVIRGPTLEPLIAVEAPPVKQEPPPVPLVVPVTDKERPMPAHDELVAFAREVAVANDLLPDLYVRQINQESGFNPKAVSRAGARGIAQFMPLWWENGEFDPFDPFESLRRSAAWMGALTRQYGDALRPLLHYNGGVPAVAAYAEGKPFSESVQYVRAIFGNLTIAQFEANGDPSHRLQEAGFAPESIRSACAPILTAGLATSLGVALTPEQALGAAPEFGWTLAGMNGPANWTRLARAFGMAATAIGEDEARAELWRGRCVVISTPQHYYLAQWPSRVDDDLYVGLTGLARRGGHEWMSLAEIRALDQGINGLFVAERAAVVESVPDEPEHNNPDPITDALSNLHDLTLTPGPHSEERRVSAQVALNTIKERLAA